MLWIVGHSAQKKFIKIYRWPNLQKKNAKQSHWVAGSYASQWQLRAALHPKKRKNFISFYFHWCSENVNINLIIIKIAEICLSSLSHHRHTLTRIYNDAVTSYCSVSSENGVCVWVFCALLKINHYRFLAFSFIILLTDASIRQYARRKRIT